MAKFALLALLVCFLAIVNAAPKSFTYHLQVTPHAKHEVTGRDIAEGEAVVLGTDFSFEVELYTTKGKVDKGDFSLIFTVQDSSLVPLYTEKLDGSNGGEFSFKWRLEKADFPSGKLAFRFDVEGDAYTYILYEWNTNIVASEINFSSSAKKLGEKNSVSMVPATFVESINPLSAEHSAKRKFYLDVLSTHGRRIASYAGVPSGSKYDFNYDISPRLDFIGNNILSFRYEAADGSSFTLMNFDSAAEEIFDDQHALNYTVNADLRMVNVEESPSSHNFNYGSEVAYKFQVKDLASSKLVDAGRGRSNIIMSLVHMDEASKKTFTSAEVSAKQVGNNFVINWPVDPNAMKGEGFLTISARDADDNELAVLSEQGDALNYRVEIGGDISFTSQLHSSSSDNILQSVFVVEFTPFCEGKPLQGAHLTCSVTKDGHEILSVPVISNNKGSYSVSWTQDQSDTAAGDYRLVFYRAVDQRRANEEAEFKRRKAEREARLRGEEYNADSGKLEVPSFYEMTIHHEKPFFGSFLIVRPETVVLFLFGYLFYQSLKATQ